MSRSVAPARSIRGTLRVPGDKSIAHRALMLGALADGTTRIDGLPDGADVASTRRCLEALGVAICEVGASVAVVGLGRSGALGAAGTRLDCGNSGTTMRLLAGILAARDGDWTLDGDASLRARPMRRVAEPLRAMGAAVELQAGDVAPMRVRGNCALRAIDYRLPLPSAQLKSALLLAGLSANGTTTLSGALEGRDHTERMLPAFGARVERRNGTLAVRGGQHLTAARVRVPGDVSSAAYWIAAATLLPDSEVTIVDVGLNPTRLGFLEVLRRMGADIERNVREENHREENPEPVGTIVARSARLRATDVEPAEVPALIDELPLLAVLAAFAEGTTTVRGAAELRVKESDRIDAVVRSGRAMGMRIDPFPDGFAVHGPALLDGASIDAGGDHRIAMAFAIAALAAHGDSAIADAESASVSYPGFFSALESLRDG